MTSTKARHRSTLGRSGTTTAYRKGCRCAPCTAANTAAKRRTRERRKQAGSRPLLSIVDGDTPPPAGDVPSGGTSGYHHVPAYGPTEKALRADIDELEPSADFGRAALIQGALALARQIDDIVFQSSKGPIVKTLVDTIRAIRGKEDSGGESLEGLLSSLTDPVSGTASRDQTEP